MVVLILGLVLGHTFWICLFLPDLVSVHLFSVSSSLLPSLSSFLFHILSYFLSCLGCANKSTESNVWDTVAPLYSALVRVKYCALFWEHFFKEIMIKVMYIQRFSHNKDEEQVSLFTLFTWEKRSHVITLQISERILCSREIRLIFHFQEAEATGASSKEVHISSA